MAFFSLDRAPMGFSLEVSKGAPAKVHRKVHTLFIIKVGFFVATVGLLFWHLSSSKLPVPFP